MNDSKANGFGLDRGGEEGDSKDQKALCEREAARFDALQRSGAMGMKAPITNAGIVIEGMAGSYGYGEGGSKPEVQEDK